MGHSSKISMKPVPTDQPAYLPTCLWLAHGVCVPQFQLQLFSQTMVAVSTGCLNAPDPSYGGPPKLA